MHFYQKFQYSYQYNYNISTNLISWIQNNSWNSWKFSGVKKTPYTVYIYTNLRLGEVYVLVKPHHE